MSNNVAAVLGSTGQVGNQVLRHALASNAFSSGPPLPSLFRPLLTVLQSMNAAGGRQSCQRVLAELKSVPRTPSTSMLQTLQLSLA